MRVAGRTTSSSHCDNPFRKKINLYVRVIKIEKKRDIKQMLGYERSREDKWDNQNDGDVVRDDCVTTDFVC
jgi:FKBP-type peptidyl-prolyl cis-trans isomerase (trigger factor)